MSRVRRNPDGSYWLPKANRQIEDQLDEQMVRIPGTLSWFPRFQSRDFSEIYKLIEGKEVNIIGKGPTLDTLKADDLGGRPTFAINEAIRVVEKLNDPAITFCITQDGGLKDTCRPKEAGLIVNYRVISWYADYPKLWSFMPHFFDLGLTAITARVAAKIAERGKAASLRMLAFDAATNQDLRYASSVGYRPNIFGPPARFLSHRQDIESTVKLSISWGRPVS